MLKVSRDLLIQPNSMWAADDKCFELWKIKYDIYDSLGEIKNQDLWFKLGEWVMENVIILTTWFLHHNF
jgi:hypothetical protein